MPTWPLSSPSGQVKKPNRELPFSAVFRIGRGKGRRREGKVGEGTEERGRRKEEGRGIEGKAQPVKCVPYGVNT